MGFAPEHMKQLETRWGKEWSGRLRGKPCISVEPGRRRYVEGLLEKILAEQNNRDVFSDVLICNYLSELLAFCETVPAGASEPQNSGRGRVGGSGGGDSESGFFLYLSPFSGTSDPGAGGRAGPYESGLFLQTV